MAAVFLSLVLIFTPLICQGREGGDIHIQRRAVQKDGKTGGFVSMDPDHPTTVSFRQATIISPGYPGNYPANLSDVLLSIDVPKNETEGYVSLHFRRFDLQTCRFCRCDYLHIDALHMSLCGNSLPPIYINNNVIIPREKILNDLITLEFRSNTHDEFSGFAIEYEMHTYKPRHTHHAHGHSTPTSPRPVSRCPVADCPMCGQREGHVIITINSCPKCVCVVTPSTSAPLSSACPVANCPSCSPGIGHRMITINSCSKCVCISTPSTSVPPTSACTVANCPTCSSGMGHQTININSCPKCVCMPLPSTSIPLTSACPVAHCPTCSPGMGHRMIHNSGCPRCVCFPVSTTTAPTTLGGSILYQLLEDLAHRAETMESKARHIKDEIHQASSILLHQGVAMREQGRGSETQRSRRTSDRHH